MTGWQCPACGACYAPWVSSCQNCKPRSQYVTHQGTFHGPARDPSTCRRQNCYEPAAMHLVTAFGRGNFCKAHGSELNARIDITDRSLPIGWANAHPHWVRQCFDGDGDPVPA